MPPIVTWHPGVAEKVWCPQAGRYASAPASQRYRASSKEHLPGQQTPTGEARLAVRVVAGRCQHVAASEPRLRVGEFVKRPHKPAVCCLVPGHLASSVESDRPAECRYRFPILRETRRRLPRYPSSRRGTLFAIDRSRKRPVYNCRGRFLPAWQTDVGQRHVLSPVFAMKVAWSKS